MATDAEPRPAAPTGYVRVGLLRSGYVLSAGVALASFLGLVFWLVAATRNAPSTVGTASAFVAAATVIAGAGSAGFGAVYARFVPRAGARWGSVVGAGHLIAACVVIALTGLFALAARGQTLSFVREPRWLLLLGACGVCWTLFALQDFALTALQRPYPVVLENAAVALLRLPLLYVHVSGDPVADVVLAWLTPTALAVVVISALLVGRRHGWAPPALATRPRRGEIAAYAMLAAPGSIATTILLNLMPVLVAETLGSVANAQFYVPWTVATAFLALVGGMVGPFSSAVAHGMTAANERGTARRLAIHSIGALAAAGLALVAMGPPVLALVGSDYRVGRGLLGMLVASAIIGTLVAVDLARLRGHGRAGRGSVVQWIGATVLLGASVPLMRTWELSAAGIAAVLAQGAAYLASRAFIRSIVEE